MNSKHILACLLLTLSAVVCSAQDQQLDKQGFRQLFNGENLNGWVLVNTPKATWTVKDNMLVCSGKPTGEIRTDRMYQNFILELEWRHLVPKGNAGVFVWADDITSRGVPFHRSIEVQVLENAYGNTRGHTTHGDIFPIHGAKMKPKNGRGGSRAFPTENRSNASPKWNHYRIECRDGNISLAVNGKVVTQGTDCTPSKGYICLESEGGVVNYRNIRIQELPDTPVDKADIAISSRGFRSIYSGLDLNGWRTTQPGWKSRNWVLAYGGEGQGTIESADAYADIGFVCDFKSKSEISVSVSGSTIDVPADGVGKGWHRLEGVVRGSESTFTLNGKPISAKATAEFTKSPIRLISNGPADFANIYVRELD